jgi:hypothetical protein
MRSSEPITVIEFMVALPSLREVVPPFETCRPCCVFRFIGDPDDAEKLPLEVLEAIMADVKVEIGG